MSDSTRQFWALSKKNWINWKRSPKCSFCEICCASYVFFVLVWIRSIIDVTTFDLGELAIARHPVLPAFQYDDAVGNWTTTSSVQVSQQVQDFMEYNRYPINTKDPLANRTEEYNSITDAFGMVGFIPSQCFKNVSFQIEKVEAPVIAVVGDKDMPITAKMTAYLQTTIKLQLEFIDYIGPEKAKQLGLDEYPDFQFMYFDSKSDLDTYIQDPAYLTGDYLGVCYGYEILKSGDSYTANLFFNDQTTMGGQKSVGMPNQINPVYNPTTAAPNLNDYLMLSQRGFVYLQNLAANIILQEETGNNNAQIALMTLPENPTGTKTDAFSQFLGSLLPLFILLMYIPPVYNTTFLIVREKESRTKESMRMMGMSDWPYWLSWFFYYTCINSALTFIAWMIIRWTVIRDSNTFIIWLYMWLYGEAIFGEIVFLQSFFNTSKYAGIVASLGYFFGQLADVPVQAATAPYGLKLMFSIVPQVAMQQNAVLFASFEGAFTGVQFDSLFETVSNFSFGAGLVMLILGFWFWTLFGLYLDAVLPKTYGDRLPAFFCCTRKFWCGVNREDDEENRFVDHEQLERKSTLKNTDRRQTLVDPFELKYLKRENYEPVAPEVARLELEDKFLKISDLTKVYENGFKAVNGINLKMYNGQIFSLLGHNGAGKSTTISMLSGLLKPSTGKASVFEHDMFNQMSKVRQYMGICPQHDVLFDNLTPEEHLDIFYDFKGGDPARKREELVDLIRDVSLGPDKKKVAASLSGGNKRKLSVCIALCGGSKLVMLDEPTAGMDLGARRNLWDMLKNYKRDRIMILTTHYMDEADVLGDRIGIMAAGKILCLGTSLFLKDRYGAGFKLTIVKKTKKANKKIQPYLEHDLGKIEKLSEVSSEITFKIPAEKAPLFQEFFERFDKELESLDVLSYGISMTTLEEVFIRANEDHRDGTVQGSEIERVDELLSGNKGDKSRGSSIQNPMAASDDQQDFDYKEEENLVAQGSLADNITAVLTKRAHIYKRDRTGLVCEVIIPIILVVIGLSLTKVNFLKPSNSKPLVPSAFPLKQRILINDELIADNKGDITPLQLYNNLPDVDASFEYKSSSDGRNWTVYTKQVYDMQFDGSTNPIRYGSYLIYQADKENQQWQFNTYVNTTSDMVTAYYPQFMYQSILKTALDKPNFEFNVNTQPFPVFWVFQSRSDQTIAFNYAIDVAIAIALIPCVMVSYILNEREKQLKHMQVISGMSLTGYWLANIMSDIIKCYVPVALILLLSWLFSANDPGVWVLFMLYPFAIVPFSYMTTFLFSSDTSAQIMTLFVHFMFAGVLGLSVYTLQIIPQTADAGDQLRWWFCLVPTFPVTHAILYSTLGEILDQAREVQGKPGLPPERWAFYNLGGDATAMALHFFVGILVITLIETDIFAFLRRFTLRAIPPRKQDLLMDDDVVREEERVAMQGNGHQRQSQVVDAGKDNEALLGSAESGTTKGMDVVRVNNFRKAYTTWFGQPFMAVERISFGLDYGECFALLGVNGAGKTTTFKSLTRDTEPTEGQISVSGYNIQSEFSQARKLIGYCPQHDAIFDKMTVEEHLWFYAKIKGIPADKRAEVIEKAIEQLHIQDQRKKPAGTLSGGNKRKLSVAIAIIGNPPIILLDEPSAGMDPEARRFMWQVVEKISQRDKKSAVILTTHSMEEAEALSTKMGIMVRGGIFRCFGSSQHIKNKFGVGYEIEVKIQKPKLQDLEELAQKLQFHDVDLQQKINLQQSIQQSTQAGFNTLILEQITKTGLGIDLVMEADSDPEEQVRMMSFIQFLYTQERGFLFIEFLSRQFEQVELLEQCSDFYKIRVPKEDKTIGYLFGQIEGEKDKIGVAEYGVSQTSLEQIFQNFAQQSVDDKAALTFQISPMGQLMLLNPDRKSTMKQQRYSERGIRPETGEPIKDGQV